MTSVKQKRAAIHTQANKNRAAAADMAAGARKIAAAAGRMKSAIRSFKAETRAYIEDFYFGEGTE